MSEQLPPAGWHPDPHDAKKQRYWDGTAWTDHVAPAHPITLQQRRHYKIGVAIAIGLGLLGIAITTVGYLERQERDAEREALWAERDAEALDNRAALDAKMLGHHIESYFRDDISDLTVEVEGNSYIVVGDDDTQTEPRSEGVEFGGFTSAGPDEWCVWVTAPEGIVKDYQYTAENGRESGSCEAY